MRNTFSRWCLLALLIVPLVSSAAFAQTFTGGLRGAVRDSGGVVPGVTVQLINENTNQTREAVSNDQGEYNFAAVPPGTYTIKASLTGFKTYQNTGVRITTQQFLTLDINVEVGQVQETITVTGDAPLIETSNASTGGVLDRQALEVLPSPGRNAFLIGVSVPTVMPNGDPQFNRQQDQSNASLVSIGGGGIRANNYLLDGVPITELVGRAVLNPTIEALEEVKVQVHTYDAEAGRTGGGVFNVTARSGTNEFHGSGFYQTRPVWGQTENFFTAAQGLTKEQSGLASVYYRLYGGGVGGPIWKNRTFFWAATEGYRSNTTRNERQIWPSAQQRAGDFSASTIGGQPVRIFNPFCRGGAVTARCPATGTGSVATGGEFTSAIIPRTHPAANPAGFGLLAAWPTQTIAGPINTNQNNEPNAEATGPVVDAADMYSVKVEHRFTDTWSMSGLYIYNKTDEPGSTIMRPEEWYIASQDRFFGPLRRRPHVAVVNNTNIINDTTVLTLRYGFSTWQDACDPQPFSAGIGSLGFSSTYTGALAETNIFPSLTFDEVADVGGWGGTQPTRWKSPYTVNGTLSKLWGSHSFKAGADLRRMGIETITENAMGGTFNFNRLFSSNAGVGGHELASVLLGVPATGSVPFNRGLGEWYTTYYGAYVQDDWRVSQRLSVNFGVRFEHEDGLREINDRQTVGFDQSVASPLDSRVPKTGLLAGRTIRGGLIFAGVDGAPTYQGDPAAVKVAPRGGFSYSLNSRTVVRGGYGLFYAPWNYSRAQHGQIGFTRTTSLNQADSLVLPITTLDNPFPAGLQQPVGSSLGLLTGTGGTINYVDQNKGNPKVHQYSIDVQRELPGNMAITIGYVGATGRDVGFFGTANAGLNINQIDPAVARAAFPGPNGTWNPAALLASVPNPFFGVPGTGEFGSRATIQAGQLLRPFPQFGDINQFERTEGGRRQYHAATIELEKRRTGWWGGRYSYTFSRTNDNQFGQAAGGQTRTALPQNVYDLDAEYGVSNFDSPHRIILAPILRFPDSSSSNGAARVLLSGWNLSAAVELVSGSPLNAVLSTGVSNNNLGLFGGRQRPNLVGDPNTSGSDNDRVATVDQAAARYFAANAFANPGPGAFGNAPRTVGDARAQFRKNLDLVLAKDTKFGSQTGQIRFEILNLTNTAKFQGIDSNAIDQGSFGRITAQAGFMRIWQLSFRYTF